ncbi:MAG: hypothetical protein KC503_18460 [Myxococcales bacterium]|nr:hypothetical protein [Myxococcales bacterium]
MSRTVGLCVIATLLALPVASASADNKSPTYRRNRGRVVIKGTPFAEFSSEKQFAKIVSKARRNTSLTRDARGRWKVHFIAFLRSAPGASKVNVVWYNLKPKREQVDYTEFTMGADQVTLKSKLTLSPTAGFKAGQHLEMRVTRIIGGRERVYAKTRVTLK